MLAVLLTAVAAALILTLPDVTDSTRPSPIALGVVLAAGFAVTEFSVFKFTFRRESMRFSLSEIPLAFSLVYLAPGPALVVRVLGSMAVVLLLRLPAYKLLLNVALFTFEVALAFVVFRRVIQYVGSGDAQLVVAVIATDHGRWPRVIDDCLVGDLAVRGWALEPHR